MASRNLLQLYLKAMSTALGLVLVFIALGAMWGLDGILLWMIMTVVAIPAFMITSRIAYRDGQGTLKRSVDALTDDARRMALGDYRHRITSTHGSELTALAESVNEMADRLIRDQKFLSENVKSLDTTNRELIEARNEVIRTARLASVGTLAAGVAHEVGNPLSAILAYIDVVRSRIDGDDATLDLLDSVRDEAFRIDRIVRSLLDYAKPAKEVQEEIDPVEVVSSVRELLVSQGRLDRVEHRWDLEKGADRVVADPHHLEQVLVNLLLNALEAMEGIGEPALEISVRTEPGPALTLPQRRRGDPPGVSYAHRRRIGAGSEGHGGSLDPLIVATKLLVIRVADTGPGIDKRDLDRVFDPFFTTKSPGKGTGLGLAICARLVDGMGGSIDVRNRPEGGAEFALRFRIADDGMALRAQPDADTGQLAEEA